MKSMTKRDTQRRCTEALRPTIAMPPNKRLRSRPNGSSDAVICLDLGPLRPFEGQTVVSTQIPAPERGQMSVRMPCA
jgi:hypothetical protein